MRKFSLTKPMPRGKMALLCAALALGLAASCAVSAYCRAQLAAGAALQSDTLRLHVRADSDSVFDQSVKLRVRDAVLQTAAACPAADKAAATAWAAASLPRIQLEAQRAMARLGVRGGVRVQLVNMYFAAAHYPGGQLPAGRYDAVRVELGADGRSGKNWWCVLYPGLCVSACGGYAQPEENDLVCGDYILRFKLVDICQSLAAAREDRPLLALRGQ